MYILTTSSVYVHYSPQKLVNIILGSIRRIYKTNLIKKFISTPRLTPECRAGFLNALYGTIDNRSPTLL